MIEMKTPNFLTEQDDAEHRRDGDRQHDAHGDTEPLILEWYPQE